MNIQSIASIYCPPFLRSAFERIENSPLGLRLARGVFWSFAGSVISRGLMLVATIFVARILGKTVYGELGMIQSTVGMFGIFAGFGLGLTATKHVAEFRQNDPGRAGRIIGLSGLFAMLTSGLMALGLLLFAPWLAEHTINAPHLAGVLRVGALILFISGINGAQTGALSGFEAFKTIAYVNLFGGLISFPILVCSAWFGGLMGAVWALAINLVFIWLLNHLALRREARRFSVPFTLRQCGREWPILWRFSLPAVISGMMVGPALWVAKSMLANQPNGYAGLGAFAAAESLRAILFFTCGMITDASFPILAQLYGHGDRVLFKKTLFTQFCLTGAIVSLGVLIVILLSKPIMNIYGPEFSNNSFVLVLVMMSCIPMQLAAVAGLINKCVGNIWWGVLLNCLWAVVFLLSTAILIGNGVLGLAWATLISYCFHLSSTTIYMVWVFRTSPKLTGEFVS